MCIPLWKLHWVSVSQQGLGIWMSFMTWIRLTVHWIVSDCDLGKVSVYTPSRGCVGLHVVWIIYRRFIEDFPRLAAPMTRLARKEVKFDWDDRCEEAF